MKSFIQRKQSPSLLFVLSVFSFFRLGFLQEVLPQSAIAFDRFYTREIIQEKLNAYLGEGSLSPRIKIPQQINDEQKLLTFCQTLGSQISQDSLSELSNSFHHDKNNVLFAGACLRIIADSIEELGFQIELRQIKGFFLAWARGSQNIPSSFLDLSSSQYLDLGIRKSLILVSLPEDFLWLTHPHHPRPYQDFEALLLYRTGIWLKWAGLNYEVIRPRVQDFLKRNTDLDLEVLIFAGLIEGSGKSRALLQDIEHALRWQKRRIGYGDSDYETFEDRDTFEALKHLAFEYASTHDPQISEPFLERLDQIHHWSVAD